jgi:HlyD family secretion protein
MAHAQAQARRYEQLFAERVVTEELLAARRQDLQLTRAARDAVQEEQARALSDLQALRAQRGSLRLIAPIDGIVSAREAEPGTTLVAGQAVVELVDPASLWVNTRFDQVSAGGLAAAQPAQVALRSRRGRVAGPGHVLRTELRADAVTEELLAKVAFDAIPRPLPPDRRARRGHGAPAGPAGRPEPAQTRRCSARASRSASGRWRPSACASCPCGLAAATWTARCRCLKALRAGDSVVLHSEKALSASTRVKVLTRIPGVAP